jgi:transcriptional regulator with XRE-family HTH domain
MTFVGVKTSLRKRFGLRVKELRQATVLSQEAFADRCGFARSYMSRIERGGANPSLDAVQVLADGLGVHVSKLFLDGTELTAASLVVEVPFARDGSYFSPATFRPNTKQYSVGAKGSGNTKYFINFNDALAYLQSQREAKRPVRWWRPYGSKGKWGLVTAVRWGALPSQDSEKIPPSLDDSNA